MKFWDNKKIKSLKSKHIRIQKYWFHDDIFKSAFFDTASILIPNAEDFIVTLIKKISPLITDKKLMKERDLLIEEESAHSQVHNRYNKMLENEGYIVKHYEKSLERFQQFVHRHLSLKSQLAFCAGVEHMTACMSVLAIDKGIIDKGIDERMRKVWLWHFLEEIDHRHVTFDIYRYMGGGYVRRILIMFLVMVVFTWYNIRIRTGLLHQGGHFAKLGVHVSGLKFLWGKNGFHRGLIHPMIFYFSPFFHPNKIQYKELSKHAVHRYRIEGELISYFPNTRNT